MKRIVMFSGGVETLTYFSREMAKTFEQKGYLVFFYDLKKGAADERRLRKFIKPGETVVITFNFEGLEKEPGVYHERTGYIWQEYRLPCFNIAADHPYYYHERLHDLPEQYYHISIDKKQQQYFETYYSEYKSFGFLPLAGTEHVGAESSAGRTTDILLTGNYTPPSFCDPYINWINEEYAAFYRGIIDDLLAHPEMTVEEVAGSHCEREMGAVAPEDFRLAMHKMIFIDLFVRNYFRGEVVKTLVEAGISVDVIGKGWEQLACNNKECLHIHPQTDSVTCLEELGRAKISLNVMPWFKDGAHDRVFNSILNGALCVSDPSEYLCGELKEGEGVCYYDLSHLEKLPEKVKELLQNETMMQDMVAKGKKKVLEHHTWKQRAEWLETQIGKLGF